MMEEVKMVRNRYLEQLRGIGHLDAEDGLGKKKNQR